MLFFIPYGIIMANFSHPTFFSPSFLDGSEEEVEINF